MKIKFIINNRIVCFLFFLFSSLIYSQEYRLKEERTIFFDFDKSDISADSKKSLDSLIQTMSIYSDYKITIDGYTDSIGSISYNKILAEKRAESVYDYLIGKEIDSSRFGYVGIGREDNEVDSDMLQRNTTIKAYVFRGCYLITDHHSELVSNGGTRVYAQLTTDTHLDEVLSVEDIFSARSMIENEMYAIDYEQNILETAGMLNLVFAPDFSEMLADNRLIIKIPIQQGKEFDEEMTIWEIVLDKNGQKRWKENNIKPQLDRTGEYYVFVVDYHSLNSYRRNTVGLNIDKPVMVGKRTDNGGRGRNREYKNLKKPIYISTFKEFDIKDVALEPDGRYPTLANADFSAKLNDTLYVFVYNPKDNFLRFTFKGYSQEGREENEFKSEHRVSLEARLRNTIRKRPREVYEHRIICERCNYISYGVEYNERVSTTRQKRNFFQRIGDLFR